MAYHHHWSMHRPFLMCLLINVSTFILTPFSQRQAILIYLMCIFLLEYVLAKCIVFCIWVFKNLHKWQCAEYLIPFLAFFQSALYFQGLSVLLCVQLIC